MAALTSKRRAVSILMRIRIQQRKLMGINEIRIRNPGIQDKVNWINIMQACNTNQVNKQKW